MRRLSHPSAQRLASYTAGDLPVAPGLVVAAHLEACAQCRQAAAAIEHAEGELLQSLPDAPLPPDLLERTLARLGDETPVDPPPGRLGDTQLPAAVAAAGLRTRRYITPQLWIAPVRVPPHEGWRAYVLRAPAGFRIPSHRHHGEELVCVLHGAFRDGGRHAAGDFVENPGEAEHELRVTEDGPCASLVAAKGGAAWSGLLGVAAPLLGI